MKLEDAEKMVCSLMKYHGVLGWNFEWLQPRKKFNRAGQCSGSRKTISLQPYFVLSNYPMIVKRTVLHEIAHALTPGQHHNRIWKEKAVCLGHSGSRTYGKEVKKRIKHKLLK